jgi:hypothetical protein
VVDYISKPFSPEALQAVVSHVVQGAAPAGVTLGAGQALAGDLRVFSASDALELVAGKALTGSLVIASAAGGARVEVALRDGHIDLALGQGLPEELLIGRFAAQAGNITPAALAGVLEERARATGAPPPLLGADLVVRGLIAAGELQQALTRQTSELVFEALRWTEGTFQFRRTAPGELPEPARKAALAINVDRLLLEGFRRVDEWRVIEREIASFDEVFVREENKIAGLPRGTFTREELAVLEVVNGRNTVRDMIRTLRMGSFDVSRVLFRLLRAKLARRRIGPTATT